MKPALIQWIRSCSLTNSNTPLNSSGCIWHKLNADLFVSQREALYFSSEKCKIKEKIICCCSSYSQVHFLHLFTTAVLYLEPRTVLFDTSSTSHMAINLNCRRQWSHQFNIETAGKRYLSPTNWKPSVTLENKSVSRCCRFQSFWCENWLLGDITPKDLPLKFLHAHLCWCSPTQRWVRANSKCLKQIFSSNSNFLQYFSGIH